MKRRTFAGLVASLMLFGAGSALASPANDDIANATLITSVPFTDALSTADAGTEDDEPRPCGFIGSTVWYRYTSTIDGYLIANTFGSDFDTALAVYQGSLFDPHAISCNTDALGSDARVQFYVHPGGTYYIQVGGESSRRGNLVFSLARPASIEGRVTDAADADPIHEICVDVFNTDSIWIGTDVTDREGDYRIGLLPEGSAKVRFTDCETGAYGREWFSDKASFATADPILLVGGSTTGAIDAALGIRPGPDLGIVSIVVDDVPLEIAETPAPLPASYNRDVTVTIDNHGPIAGRRVIVHAEVCPSSVGSCKDLGDKRIGRVRPGEQETVTFDWNAIDTIGDVSLFVSVFGTRDMDAENNVVESERSVWIGGTGFGVRLCRLPTIGPSPCVTD